MKRKQLLFLLALLMTAATGAWAQDAKHRITATLNFTSTTKQKTLDVTLPYETTIGAVYTAITGQAPASSLSPTAAEVTSGTNVSIGGLNGWDTPVNVTADGDATVGFTATVGGSGINGTITLSVAPVYAVKLADGTQDAKNWTIASGDNSVKGDVADGLTGLNEKDAVTLTYGGHLKVKSVTATTDAGPGPLATPLTIEAITAGSINVMNPKVGMQYSLDGGKTKNAVTTDAIAVAAGDKVQFYGDGTNITCYGSASMSDCTRINGIGYGFTCKVYGNIMSLVDEKNFASATTLSDTYNFSYLFADNSTLTDASELLLPAMQLQEGCYQQMFFECNALTAAPALPATQLAMSCYRQMFEGCTALTAAPVLPAAKLVRYCYIMMFNYCLKLATVTCLATSGINQDNSTSYWLSYAGSQVQGTKTVNTFSTASWPEGDNGIPDGWTRVNIDN